ncbi:hypothetical protein [Alistipes finegoldii]|uniref:hypothetical protein n=1 Tax=Alistipes finegoldii TaxID=214856 RepID=UPI0039914E3E
MSTRSASASRRQFFGGNLDMLLKDICIPASDHLLRKKMANVAELVWRKSKEGIAKEDVRIAFCIDPLVKGFRRKAISARPTVKSASPASSS